MFGTFQQSKLRIEVPASESVIRASLMNPSQLQQWLWPQTLSEGLPDELCEGLTFNSWIGPIMTQHYVDAAAPNKLRLILSQGIDGFHEWYWDEGWLQSHLEGVSALPLNLGQTLSLLRLRQFLAHQEAAAGE